MIATTQLHHELQKIIRQGDEENRRCADCNTPNPTWASINIGCFLCLECSGIHRNLGTHISKVRSTTLDKWNKAWVQHMRAVGNRKVNSYYEAKLPAGFRHPSNLKDKNEFIRLKYQGKKWYGDPDSDSGSGPGQSSNAFGVARKSAQQRKAPETAAQRAKRRAEERRKKEEEDAASAAVNGAAPAAGLQKGNQRHSQQQSQQQSQQSAAPTSTLARFKASASSGTVPAVSPISGRQRKTSRGTRNSSDSGTGKVETAAERAARRKQQQQQQSQPQPQQMAADSGSMFDGLSSGGASGAPASGGAPVEQTNMFAGLSSGSVDTNPRDRATSRESLEKNLAQRRPSVELQAS